MNDWKPNEKVTQWRKLAEYWGRQTECPAALILAVIEQESGGDKDAVRYEPEYEKRYKARCEEISHEADIAVLHVYASCSFIQASRSSYSASPAASFRNISDNSCCVYLGSTPLRARKVSIACAAILLLPSTKA